MNADNLNTEKRKAGRHFWKKNTEYLKDNINKPEINSKNKNIEGCYRDMHEFKKGCQH
jgi:hypothetical protein